MGSTRSRRVALLLVVAICAAAACARVASGVAGPQLRFTLFDATGLPLGQVLWTGGKFLYVAEHTGTIKASDPLGKTVTPFASFRQGGDEMRCAESPGARHHWTSALFCHTADNRIVEVSPDGTTVTPFAELPADAGKVSDGGIAFDNVGKFGYRMLVSSGGSTSNGGTIYAYSPDGSVTRVGDYPGPGGADNIIVAPASFGSAGGSLLIAIDQTLVTGRVLAVNSRGKVTVLASNLANGVNGIEAIRQSPRTRPPGSARPGFYFGDYNSGNVYYAPAASLKPYVGDVIVSAEEHAWFWLLKPNGRGFKTQRIPTNLPTKDWSIEGTAYVP